MKLITQFEPKITRYMVPGAFNRIEFYGQAGLDLDPEPMNRARELTIIELLEDSAQTRFVTFAPALAVQRHWSDMLDERLVRELKDSGQWLGWLQRARREVPPEIPTDTEDVPHMLAVKVSAKWWEVSW